MKQCSISCDDLIASVKLQTNWEQIVSSDAVRSLSDNWQMALELSQNWNSNIRALTTGEDGMWELFVVSIYINAIDDKWWYRGLSHFKGGDLQHIQDPRLLNGNSDEQKKYGWTLHQAVINPRNCNEYAVWQSFLLHSHTHTQTLH